MATDFVVGAATSGFAAAANLVRGTGAAAKIIHQTRAFNAVKASGRLWGKTEGVVWGLSSQGGRSMINTAAVDGSIGFQGQAAQQFIRRPIEGLWSGFKNWQGQYVTRFGDLSWRASQTVQMAGNRLVVAGAQTVAHSPQWAAEAARHYWGTKFGEHALSSWVTNIGRVGWGLLNGDENPGNTRFNAPCSR